MFNVSIIKSEYICSYCFAGKGIHSAQRHSAQSTEFFVVLFLFAVEWDGGTDNRENNKTTKQTVGVLELWFGIIIISSC